LVVQSTDFTEALLVIGSSFHRRLIGQAGHQPKIKRFGVRGAIPSRRRAAKLRRLPISRRRQKAKMCKGRLNTTNPLFRLAGRPWMGWVWGSFPWNPMLRPVLSEGAPKNDNGARDVQNPGVRLSGHRADKAQKQVRPDVVFGVHHATTRLGKRFNDPHCGRATAVYQPGKLSGFAGWGGGYDFSHKAARERTLFTYNTIDLFYKRPCSTLGRPAKSPDGPHSVILFMT
jgi:hypothetical protein